MLKSIDVKLNISFILTMRNVNKYCKNTPHLALYVLY